MARLAQADLSVQDKQYDQAIATLRELSLDTKGDVPVDAVLSQLGAAYLGGGEESRSAADVSAHHDRVRGLTLRAGRTQTTGRVERQELDNCRLRQCTILQ